MQILMMRVAVVMFIRNELPRPAIVHPFHSHELARNTDEDGFNSSNSMRKKRIQAAYGHKSFDKFMESRTLNSISAMEPKKRMLQSGTTSQVGTRK